MFIPVDSFEHTETISRFPSFALRQQGANDHLLPFGVRCLTTNEIAVQREPANLLHHTPIPITFFKGSIYAII